MTPNPNLGKQGKDVVTGFTGTITGYAEYLTGSSRYELTTVLIRESMGNGITTNMPKSSWFDVAGVRISGEPIELPGNKDSG